MGVSMDSPSGFEQFPRTNAIAFLALAGISIWLLTKIDELTRSHVESRRHLWEQTSTFEIEFKKYRSRGRLFLFICIAFFLIAAITCCRLLF